MRKSFLRICALACALMLAVCAAAESGMEVDLLEVDHKLYELGYRDSACNGVLDEVTVNALRNFQRVNGLEVSGQPDDATVRALFSESAVSETAYLEGLARSYAEMPTLANGSSGEDVARLQRALKELGCFDGSVDGVYDDETEAAVVRFQLANGLEETGVADSALYLRIYGGSPVAWNDFLSNSCAVAGDSGDMVRTLQLCLKRKGYFEGACTGRYGEETQQAVRRFQTDQQIEVTGNADLDTCAALYSDAAALIHDGEAVRRGDTGTEAEELCRNLAALGYPAGAEMGMRSELALMEFQHVNGLTVTGAVDAETAERLRSGNAARRESRDSGAVVDVSEDETLGARIARQATSMLGQASDFDEDFDLVRYVYFKCGIPLMERAQMEAVEAASPEDLSAGAVIGAMVDGREICGIATSDGALICRAESGYIVARYLDALEPEAVRLYRPAGAQ